MLISTNGDTTFLSVVRPEDFRNRRARVVNLSYLTTDRYADRMRHPTSVPTAYPCTPHLLDH